MYKKQRWVPGGKFPPLPEAGSDAVAVPHGCCPGATVRECPQARAAEAAALLLGELLCKVSGASLCSRFQLVAKLLLVSFEGDLNSGLVYLSPERDSRLNLSLVSLSFSQLC